MTEPLLNVNELLEGAHPPTLPVSPEEQAEAERIVGVVFETPLLAEIPDTPGILFAIGLELGKRIDGDNLEFVTPYLDRLFHAERVEFAILALRDAARRNANLMSCEAFLPIALGPIGQILAGETES